MAEIPKDLLGKYVFTHTHPHMYCAVSVGQLLQWTNGRRDVVWVDKRRDACGRVEGATRGYWVDDCPPFVLQIRGNLQAIVAPCLFTSQRAERGDFSSTEPMTRRFFSKSSPMGSSLALLSSPSPCFVLSAVHSQPRPAIVC